jgi:hypothetical protein
MKRLLDVQIHLLLQGFFVGEVPVDRARRDARAAGNPRNRHSCQPALNHLAHGGIADSGAFEGALMRMVAGYLVRYSISKSSVQVVAPPCRAKALSSSARLLHE